MNMANVIPRSKSGKLQKILLLVSFCVCSGCGASIGVRIGAYDGAYGDSQPVGIYPATKIDLAVIAYAVAKPFAGPNSTRFPSDAQQGLVYIFLPISIADLPLAVAADTVFLPYDLHKFKKQDESVDGESIVQNVAATNSNRRVPLLACPAVPMYHRRDDFLTPKISDVGPAVPDLPFCII